MIFRTYEREDGDFVMEMDDEAIDYLIEGLEELRESEPGTEMTTPSLIHDDEGKPEAVSSYVLLKSDS